MPELASELMGPIPPYTAILAPRGCGKPTVHSITLVACVGADRGRICGRNGGYRAAGSEGLVHCDLSIPVAGSVGDHGYLRCLEGKAAWQSSWW